MPGAAAGLATPGGGKTGPVARFKAPLLDRILAAPQDPEHRTVALDLGGPCQSILERLGSTRPCRVEIADFARSGGLVALEELDPEEDDGSAIVQRILPPPGREPLNLIFCWDLPNYLSLRALKILIDNLATRAAPGCKLHMLVAYSKREIAAQPARYAMDAEGSLEQTALSRELAEVPRHTQEELAPALGRFVFERGVLLTNGMQELVYAWPEEKRPDGRPY